ncbi:3-hydroxyacyl-CoA dehydrogenase family protein [Cupriavidus basilensis]
MTTTTQSTAGGEAQTTADYVRFAQAEAARIPDFPQDLPLRPVNRVAVVGAGTMGGGIAMALANIGIPVTLIDSSQQGLDTGLGRVRDNYAGSVSRGKLEPAEMEQRLSRITGSVDLADAAPADMVIEAVFEDMALKQQVFRKLDAVCKPGAILATNTSGLDVDAIAAVTQRPQDVVGAHFFSPAHVMRLLEVVRARGPHRTWSPR